MAVTYGKIEEFNLKDNWTQYIERLGHYFDANEIENPHKKKAILLSAVGAETYELMHNLCVPELPGEKTYVQLTKLIEDHLCPKPNIIVQRCKFNTRLRHTEESVAAFVSELRSIAAKCEYSEQLNDNLRDRLVAGINDDKIQQRLFQDANLTFQTALDRALAMETASKNVRDISQTAQAKYTSVSGTSSSTVHRLQKRHFDRSKKMETICFRCGRKHNPNDCWYKNATCNKCGKIGHIKPVCRAKQGKGDSSTVFRGQQRPTPRFNSKTHIEDEQEECYSMYTVDEQKKISQIKESFVIEGQEIDMEIDTGASVSIINNKTFQLLK